MNGLLDWVDPTREWFQSRPRVARGLLDAAYQLATDPAARKSAMAQYDSKYGKPFQKDLSPEQEAAWRSQTEAFWNPAGLLGEAAMIGVMGKAKKGGQIGVNSEFYKGGQFLPGSEFTEKGKMQFPKALRAGNKAEIEPGVYAERPIDGLKPVIKTAEYDWQKYRSTGVLEPYSGWSEFQKNPALFDGAVKDSAAFNSGARWVLDGRYFDLHGKEIS